MWEPRPLTTLWASTACYRDRGCDVGRNCLRLLCCLRPVSAFSCGWNRNFLHNYLLMKKNVLTALVSASLLMTSFCWIQCRRCLEVSQLVTKFSPFYGDGKFITVLTKARHSFLSWARGIQPTSSLILFIYNQSRGVLPSNTSQYYHPIYFRLGFLSKISRVFLISPIRVTCPTHQIIE
jgi:hypothetical protein